MTLEGKVAVVTGGGRGLGAVIAHQLARDGVKVIVASRTPQQLQDVTNQIQTDGLEARAVVADVSDPTQVTSLMDDVQSQEGHIDILVNAAGVYGPIGNSHEVDSDEWMQAIRINVFGTYLCCRAVLPLMLAQRWGRIINFSGGGATAPLPRFSAYAVSKAAVVRLTETMAEESRDSGVCINAIAPGMVDTQLQDEVLKAGDRAGELASRIRALRETGEGGTAPELAAGLVVFLASDRAAQITGKLIAAPYDDWEDWDHATIEELTRLPWFTLRRIDRHTLAPFLEEMNRDT